jgi:hypothetical protein
LAKVFPRVFIASKRSNVTCFGYESIPKKLITRANLSCNPFEIQRSMLSIAKLHYAKTSKTYNCLVFFTKGTSLVKIIFWKEKPILDI